MPVRLHNQGIGWRNSTLTSMISSCASCLHHKNVSSPSNALAVADHALPSPPILCRRRSSADSAGTFAVAADAAAGGAGTLAAAVNAACSNCTLSSSCVVKGSTRAFNLVCPANIMVANQLTVCPRSVPCTLSLSVERLVAATMAFCIVVRAVRASVSHARTSAKFVPVSVEDRWESLFCCLCCSKTLY